MLTYFAFTSLSTVGLGDYYPVSNLERLLGAFILLFGVSITSFIMDRLNHMILQINSLQKDFEWNNEMSLFIKTLEKFNHNEGLSFQLQESLNGYFQYRWQYNKNNAVSTPEDIFILT